MCIIIDNFGCPGATLNKSINVFCKIVMEFYIYNKIVLLEKITCYFDFFSLPSWGACRRWSLRCRPRWRWNQTSESWCRTETRYFSPTCSPHPHACLHTHSLTWSFHIHPSLHVFRSASSQHCFCYRKIHPSALLELIADVLFLHVFKTFLKIHMYIKVNWIELLNFFIIIHQVEQGKVSQSVLSFNDNHWYIRLCHLWSQQHFLKLLSCNNGTLFLHVY